MSEAPQAPPGTPAPAARLPRTVLLLGTDAAGKNHVARAWIRRRMTELGRPPVVQEGWIAGPPVGSEAEEAKSWFSHGAERLFLAVFPAIAWLMPFALYLLIRRDARRFRDDGRPRLVVSHSGLRILAFCLGARGRGVADLSAPLRRAVRDLQSRSGARVVVLDVDHEVRRQRIEKRLARGDSDPFDRYMLADPDRSERIEACLVDLAVQLMDAHLVVNNDLDDEALWACLEDACETSGG